ncbi:unnamed protein product [Spirodela intermedia]|uniref:Uncharacterized protein n=2 Tax=Spirodela intermedia TaxID=51605 RepID=A0A7I8K4J0_SPIIN|nr:unnamed protein product [Spirodela intermedia]CAA6655962.1 unnamed protein product [Spirodela intermedia]CAA7391372.1 unnamed protein product [Spirodela intermedia]
MPDFAWPSGGEPVDPAAPSRDEQPIPPPPVEQPAASSQSPPSAALPAAQPIAPSGTIKRDTKQQILATIPPDAAVTSQPFITSPSGNFVGCLLRRTKAPGAAGFGNDFCYIQVQDTSTGASVWESECAPASTANACSVVFTDAGLEVFDGSRPAWDAGVDADHLETLELVDEGDMRIRTQGGELAWRASDRPLANQQCGLATGEPSFAAPIGGNTNQPFGQPSHGTSSQQGNDGQQPLVDNNPFDSASSPRIRHGWLTFASALVLVAAHGFPL